MAVSFWDQYAAIGYDVLRVLLPYQALQEALFAAAAPEPDHRMLIAGCGTGNFESMAAERVPGLHIDAVDLSLGMLARAKAKCVAFPDVRHQQANLCAPLPFAAEHFDRAVMCNVLYTLPDGPAALRGIYQVLRPGGRLILCDRLPGSSLAPIGKSHFASLGSLPPRERLDRWAKTIAMTPALLGVSLANAVIQRRHTEGNYHYYSVAEITEVLTNIGYTVSSPQFEYADQCWLVRATREDAGGASVDVSD